jgi:putative peptidoglycan lipid II flippase
MIGAPDKAKSSKGVSLADAFWQIGSLTAVSRVVGFLRDIAFASFLGAGPAADAFLVALKLPNMFRRLTAEGAMTNAFLPSFAKLRTAEGREAAIELAAEAQIILILVLFGIVIVAEIFMPQILVVLAPGFAATPDRLAAAIDLGRVTMPYLPMISVVALWIAIANAHDRFMAGAAAPILANLCFIAGAISIPLFAVDLGVVRALPIAIGLLVAGLLQLGFLFFVLRRLSALPKLQWPHLSNAGRTMWRNFIPSALGAGGMQLNLLVDLILASLLPVGAVSWLYYADRVAQLPLGIVGIALGTALLPRLSTAEADEERADFTNALDEAIIFAGFFVVPAMISLIILAGPIIEGLFVYGAFTTDDAVMVAMALSAYAVGLPGFVLVKILQPAFYAVGQPIIVLKISILTIAINITGSLILMPLLGHIGLALATSLSGLIAGVVMAVLLRRRRRLDGGCIGMMGRIFLATIIMAIFLVVFANFGSGLRQFMPAALWLVGQVIFGGAVFLAAAAFFQAIPQGLVRRWRR